MSVEAHHQLWLPTTNRPKNFTPNGVTRPQFALLAAQRMKSARAQPSLHVRPRHPKNQNRKWQQFRLSQRHQPPQSTRIGKSKYSAIDPVHSAFFSEENMLTTWNLAIRLLQTSPILGLKFSHGCLLVSGHKPVVRATTRHQTHF